MQNAEVNQSDYYKKDNQIDIINLLSRVNYYGPWEASLKEPCISRRNAALIQCLRAEKKCPVLLLVSSRYFSLYKTIPASLVG